MFDTEYSHISNNKSRKVSPSFGSPYWYKTLLHTIFKLSITYFSEKFKIVKKNFSKLPILKLQSELFECQNFVWNFWTSFRVEEIDEFKWFINQAKLFFPTDDNIIFWFLNHYSYNLFENFKLFTSFRVQNKKPFTTTRHLQTIDR